MKALLDFDKEIEKILSIGETDFPIISIFLDVRVWDKTSHQKLKIFLKNELKKKIALFQNEPEKQQSLEEDAQRIRSYIENNLGEKIEGAAIFACGGKDIFYDYQLEVPFENQIVINSYPHIKPLLELKHDTQKIIVVMVDSRSARIFDVAWGAVKKEDMIADYVPDRLKVGGCSQLRFQHHVDDHILHHLKHVIDFLQDLFVRERPEGIVLSGQHDVLAAFKEALPKPLAEKIIAEETLDIRKNTDKVLRLILNDLRKRQEAKEKNLIIDIKTSALSGGLGVVGAEDTIEALNKKQPFVLVMGRQMRMKGFVCTACGQLFINEKDACPYCSAGLKEEKDLTEKILQRAEKLGVKIHLMDSSEELAEIDGIGALLGKK